jgi:hypothetical protein
MKLALILLALLAAPAHAGVVGTYKNDPRLPAVSLTVTANPLVGGFDYVLRCGSGWSTSNAGPYWPIQCCTDLNSQRGDSTVVDSIWGTKLAITGSTVGLPCDGNLNWLDPVATFRGHLSAGDPYALGFQDTTYSGFGFHNQGAWRYEPSVEIVSAEGETTYVERVVVRVFVNAIESNCYGGKVFEGWISK